MRYGIAAQWKLRQEIGIFDKKISLFQKFSSTLRRKINCAEYAWASKFVLSLVNDRHIQGFNNHGQWNKHEKLPTSDKNGKLFK